MSAKKVTEDFFFGARSSPSLCIEVLVDFLVTGKFRFCGGSSFLPY
jgi:hypothetical protein